MQRDHPFPRISSDATFALIITLLTVVSSLAFVGIQGGPTTVPQSRVGVSVFPSPIRHVVTIVLENEGYSTIMAQPYEAHLCEEFACASSYYAICHPSLPNYLSLTSGEPGPSPTDSCGGTEYPPGGYSTTSIATLLDAAGLSWNAYEEDMNAPCGQANYPANSASEFPNSTGGYAVRHDPFAYYSDLGQAAPGGVCAEHVLGWSSWYSALSSPDPAAYIFITPNTCDDGHNGPGAYPTGCASPPGDSNAAEADYWLSREIPLIQNASWYSSSVIFITYDEGESTSTAGYDNGVVAGGQTYLAAVSPYTKGVKSYTADASAFNLLCTTEWLLDVGPTGHEDCTPEFPAMRSLFHFTVSPPSMYPVSGTVQSTALLPVAGATVSISGPSGTLTEVTNRTGQFSTNLTNGTYSVRVRATGFQSVTTDENVSGPTRWDLPALSPSSPVLYLVTGTLSSATTGDPIPGATVSISGSSGTSLIVTNSSGEFSADLANGTYVVQVQAMGFLPLSIGENVSGPTSWSLPALLLVPVATYPVNGTIYSVSTGGPIPGATVYANSSNASTVAPTNSTGAFSTGLENGSYVLTAFAAGFRNASRIVNVTGARLTGVDLGLIPKIVLPPPSMFNYTVSGLAQVYPSGAPAAGATVFANNSSAGPEVRLIGEVSANGTFALSLGDGTYLLTVTDRGYDPAATVVSVDEGPQPNLTVSLFPETEAVFQTTGTVLDGANNTTIDDAEIVVQNGSRVVATLFSEENGSFTAPQIPNGTYLVTVNAAGFSTARSAIVVSGSSIQDVNISLVPAGPTGRSIFGSPISFAGFALQTWIAGGVVLGWCIALGRFQKKRKR
jgi:hypothetical protein